jgi:RHS repeat-associated protein
VYNLQGWIKGVNGFAATPAQDAGRDGIAPNPQSPVSGNEEGYQNANRTTSPDVYSYWLSYYQNDYQTIGTAPTIGQPLQPLTSGNYHSTPAELYNGNIRSMYTYLKPKGGMGMHYRYDQLNRIKTQNAWDFAGTTATPSPNGAYRMALAYDANGNIQSLLRNGNTALPAMDDLKYSYYLSTNRLAQVTDGIPTANYTHDLDNQPNNNYTYDAIGNLIADASEGIKIDWNLQNKVTQVRKANGIRIQYSYDALGNRVEKQNIPTTGAGQVSIYVRDAQGNTLAVYEKAADNKLIWAEQHLYGSRRLGMYRPQKEIPPIPAIASLPNDLINRDDTRGVILPYTHTRNTTQYELTNHLGNVLATISDAKTTSGGLGATVLTTTDYYAFGMEIKERTYNLPSTGGQGGLGLFRYGYNGKENDTDWGTGLIQDYGFRLYNPAVARFLGVDEIQNDIIDLSPYSFAANNPILLIDRDGKHPALIGLGIGVVMEFGSQMILNDYDIAKVDFADVLIAGAQGALLASVPGIAAAGPFALIGIDLAFNTMKESVNFKFEDINNGRYGFSFADYETSDPYINIISNTAAGALFGGLLDVSINRFIPDIKPKMSVPKSLESGDDIVSSVNIYRHTNKVLESQIEKYQQKLCRVSEWSKSAKSAQNQIKNAEKQQKKLKKSATKNIAINGTKKGIATHGGNGGGGYVSKDIKEKEKKKKGTYEVKYFERIKN